MVFNILLAHATGDWHQINQINQYLVPRMDELLELVSYVIVR